MDLSVKEKLHCSEKLLKEVDSSYEDKIRRTAEIEQSRSEFLQQIGLADQSANQICQPMIINLHEDEQMSERLVYCIQPGTTTVGSSPRKTNILLNGKIYCNKI